MTDLRSNQAKENEKSWNRNGKYRWDHPPNTHSGILYSAPACKDKNQIADHGQSYRDGLFYGLPSYLRQYPYD